MFHCCHWYVFRAELLTPSSIFDVLNRLLNSTDSITHEFQIVEIQTVIQHTVVQEASERTNWPQDRQSVGVKSRPDLEFRAYRLSGRRERFGIMSKEL
jgi:hypothetical protein